MGEKALSDSLYNSAQFSHLDLMRGPDLLHYEEILLHGPLIQES